MNEAWESTLWVIFALLLVMVLSLFTAVYVDDIQPDVDGKWNGFTEQELSEGFK